MSRVITTRSREDFKTNTTKRFEEMTKIQNHLLVSCIVVRKWCLKSSIMCCRLLLSHLCPHIWWDCNRQKNIANAGHGFKYIPSDASSCSHFSLWTLFLNLYIFTEWRADWLMGEKKYTTGKLKLGTYAQVSRSFNLFLCKPRLTLTTCCSNTEKKILSSVIIIKNIFYSSHR